MCNILIFGGTSEGRLLCELCSKNNISTYISVATQYGETLIEGSPYIHILTGRMTQTDIISFIKTRGILLVVDATHPYAQTVTQNIKNACEVTKIEYIRVTREQSRIFKNVEYFNDIDGIIEYLNGLSGNVLITTGSKTLEKFCAINRFADRCYARVLNADGIEDKCRYLGLKEEHIISKKPPYSYQENFDLMKSLDISYLVTKDSGTAGGFEDKLKAAEDIGAKALVLKRPEDIGVSVEAAFSKLLEFTKRHKTVYIIAAGMEGNLTLTSEAAKVLRSCDVLIGAKRIIQLFDYYDKPVFNSYLPNEISDYIHSCNYKKIAVLMSGDCGFYSGSNKLIPMITDVNTEIICGISSMVYFCSRIKTNYENICTITLHGRSANVIRNVCTHKKTFILLGGDTTASDVCKKLCKYGFEEVTVHIGENLSYPDERIITAKASDLINVQTKQLSVMLIENDSFDNYVKSCIPDNEFIRENIPMTKSEVRSICVSKLAVRENDICWDIGCGTGSVSVELALRCTNGFVYAVDKNEKAVSLTEKNSIKFRCDNIELINKDAKEAVETLPKPDCVFIGGSSGAIPQIVRAALSKNPDVRIVITAVSLETLNNSISVFDSLEIDVNVTQIAVTHTEKIGRHTMLRSENPIFIISGGLS